LPSSSVASRRWSLVRDLGRFLWKERLWWMVPMVLVLVLFGVLLYVAQSTAVTPFVYTLF